MIASHLVGFEPVIGLEIHARLLTNTKIFCGCSTRFGHAPNTSVCPVCLGFPGALPVLNRRAVDFAAKAALALNCVVHEQSIFARKNYFYPDLPKGYQISQYELPLATAGALEFTAAGAAKRVRITRVHMEEDAGKSLHEGFADSERKTYLDFNRSGTPLIEIVTEPDLRSAGDAADAFRKLREMLIALGVNDGNMEEGSLRCDANVSVRPQGATTLGTKAEVKNINSFRYLEKALEYEIARQIAVVESGGTIVQETRLWDASTRETFSMRSKEDAHDYRYFPEPDLPPVRLARERIEEIRASIVELPEARRVRVMAAYALSEAEVTALENTELTALFEETARASGHPRAAFNWVSGEVARRLNELGERFDRQRLTAGALAGLIALVEKGTISASIGKSVIEKMYDTGRAAEDIVAADGLAQIGDEGAILSSVRDGDRRQPGRRHADSRRKDGHVRLPRRSGHESHRRQSEPQTRERPLAQRVEYLIETHSLSKLYSRGVYALRDLSMQVDKGEFVFLTGPSGAGKSTFLRLLLRETLPSDGAITVAGKNLAQLTPRQVQAYRRSVGFIFQDFKLIPRKTVIENVAIVPRVLGAPVSTQQRKTFQVLKWVGLQHRMNAYPQELSGGEQQRIAIARALVNDPMLILADEPTGNLDPDLSLDIMNLLREVNARGTTVLVATHDRDLIRRVGRRVIALDHGKLVDSDERAETGSNAGS